MTVTQVDIDDEALAEAMALSGLSTKKATVNMALREYADRHRRIAALERGAEQAKGWDFEDWKSRRDADKGESGAGDLG